MTLFWDVISLKPARERAPLTAKIEIESAEESVRVFVNYSN